MSASASPLSRYEAATFVAFLAGFFIAQLYSLTRYIVNCFDFKVLVGTSFGIHFRIHDLRHFAASLMLVQGVPLKVVSEILGHAQIGITGDLYTHVLPKVRKEAIDLLDAVLTAGNQGK